VAVRDSELKAGAFEVRNEFSQLHSLRGGYRPLRRDGHEWEQVCRRNHHYESNSAEPRCPTCETLFAEADVVGERAAQRRSDNWVGLLITLLVLSLFAWALHGGVEEQGRIDEATAREARR
jgi:hypothetical protein